MIDLPSTPGPREVAVREIGWGVQLRSPLGGPTQHVDRLGSRWSIDVTLPPLTAADARVWVSRLIRAKREGGRMVFPQPGFDVGAPGSPRVAGGGQMGKSLTLDGFAPGYQIREGQFFSILTGGRRYVHQATADATATGGGLLTAAFEPMLRISPANDAVVEFAPPMIEGLVEGPATEWRVTPDRRFTIQFTLTEAE